MLECKFLTTTSNPFLINQQKNVCVQQAEDHKQVTNSDWRS